MALLNKAHPLKQAEPATWLSIVGIHENGIDGLSDEAKALISSASVVAGGKRHLELARDLIRGETLAWPSPPHDAIPKLQAMRPQPVCVLVTGDPFHYGMGAVLAHYIPIYEMRILPALSIFSLVASRLGWALQDSVMLGVNGRPLEKIIPHLQPGARIIALSADETTPAAVAKLLHERGFGGSVITVLEQVGGPNERVRIIDAASFAFKDIARLNCMAIDIPYNAESRRHALPITAGLPDDLFEHDGQMTKWEMRSVTLSALAPRRGELLWDIGLGAGSITIEWLLRDPANRAIGIEKNAERAARARRNALSLGVPDLRIIQGDAPDVLGGLEAPDAIFIGGGATVPGMLEVAWGALKPSGRLVINAISLETEALLLAAHKQYGGTMMRVGIERAEAVGTMTGWRPAMRVTQWSVSK